jgi:hypothetical protein
VRELPTVELQGVELMRAGGPYHGHGSPPEGDHVSVEDLHRIARDSNAVADELRPVNKLPCACKKAARRARAEKLPRDPWVPPSRANASPIAGYARPGSGIAALDRQRPLGTGVHCTTTLPHYRM